MRGLLLFAKSADVFLECQMSNSAAFRNFLLVLFCFFDKLRPFAIFGKGGVQL